MSDFGRMLGREIPRLRRYALALTRDSVRADDLVQSTLVRALAKSHLWQRHQFAPLAVHHAAQSASERGPFRSNLQPGVPIRGGGYGTAQFGGAPSCRAKWSWARGYPDEPAAQHGSSPDSLLEGGGFEPSVPLWRMVSGSASAELRQVRAGQLRFAPDSPLRGLDSNF
jgi:hypothetical protein